MLEQLGAVDGWGLVLAIAVFGALGGVIHSSTTDERPTLKIAAGAAVAAVGFGAFKTPSSTLELVGLSLLAGFFARGVLAALESRIELALARQQADRALALAGDAIEMNRRGRASGASPDADVGRLAARFDEIRAARQVPER
jgi:hypothetical protein